MTMLPGKKQDGSFVMGKDNKIDLMGGGNSRNSMGAMDANKSLNSSRLSAKEKTIPGTPKR